MCIYLTELNKKQEMLFWIQTVYNNFCRICRIVAMCAKKEKKHFEFLCHC